ncbi:hemin-degrading factor [Marinomonas sp. C2222]|uniref:Hemin-degrading factor n=1 Tax=Marinomonas sargassi TaxID=2984494 RepID=A0ABT2YU16_9GAMM|nr:ChuX/HutX family heme-like substrate-binding protein [Marinomonas sargassi]MCV2403387.1 hemin-degrading factor [Marinomonas sargassi]
MSLPELFNKPVQETELAVKYSDYVKENPKARRRDVAKAIEVTELEVIESQIGLQSLYLNGDFKSLLKDLPNLGYVMILLRNEYAVHERKGIYSNVKVGGPMGMGLIISDDKRIDLRLFLKLWKHGFAVRETVGAVDRYSLQFFDAEGVAIQKLYLQPESDLQAFETLVKTYANEEQNVAIELAEASAEESFAEDAEVDQAKLVEDWSNMTDVHQFMGLLKNHNVSREQSFKLVGSKFAQSFDVNKLEDVLQTVSKEQVPIMCFVGNKGGIQIHSGEVNKIVKMGDWLNVLDPEFNLHLLMSGVTSGWVIRKPSSDGIITSLELYDADSNQVAQFFGKRVEQHPENLAWGAIAEGVIS